MQNFIRVVLLALLILPSAVFAADPVQATPESEPVMGFNEDVTKSRLILGNDRWIQMHAFIQTGVRVTKSWDANETKGDARWVNDPYLGACRLIFNGQFADKVFFFIQTEDLKAGESSSSTTDTNVNNADGQNNVYTQDAYIKFIPARFFQIYTGLLTVPLSRQNMQSQATLLFAEQLEHSKVLDGYSNNGRDTGIMFRGLLPGAKPFFEYRLGLFRGLGRQIDDTTTATVDESRNKKDLPRITGRIQFNIGDAEEGYFYSENYLGKRQTASWGLGIDYQPDVYKKTKDYCAVATDISFDSPFIQEEKMAICGQAGFIKAVNYPGSTDYSEYSLFYVQTGLMINKTIQPAARFTYHNEKGYASYKTLSAGLNFFIDGHFANIKLMFDCPVGKNKDYTDEMKGTLQFQGYM